MKRSPHLLAIQSHVVFGHAGNSAAVFPMQRLGINVWPLHTAQFSSHGQYRQRTGEAWTAQQIPALIEGIAGIGELGQCDAVLSGTPDSVAQGRAMLYAVAQVKAANPRALYLSGPLAGVAAGTGLQSAGLAADVRAFMLDEVLAVADLLCPGQQALNQLCQRQAESLDDCLAMANALLARGPQAVLVNHLEYPGKPADRCEMLLVSAEGNWLLSRPSLAFPRRPAGIGELTCGLFLARILLGDTPVAALEFAASAVQEVLLETQACGGYELELVRAQDRIAHPRVRLEAQALVAHEALPTTFLP